MKNTLTTVTAILMLTAAGFGQQLAGTNHVKGETFAQFLEREPDAQKDFNYCTAAFSAKSMTKAIEKGKADFAPSDRWRTYPMTTPPPTYGNACARLVAASQGMVVEIVRPAPSYELTFAGGHLVSFGGRREENHGHYCIDYGKVYGFDGEGNATVCQ